MPEPDSTFKRQLHDLELPYREAELYAEQRQPYWLSLRQPRHGEMRWDLFDYTPLHHYRRALEQGHSRDAVPDGGQQLHTGRTTSTVYYWANPDTDATLPHMEIGDDEVVPFFGSVADAEQFLERRAEETGKKEEYKKFSLYRARVKKEGDAVDVLMEQAGIGDFNMDD